MDEQKSFSSRWALLFAMLSMAVGTGSIWRFPRIVAKNGGGTFLLPWVISLFAWSIPLIILEFALGRGMKAGPLGSIVRLIGPRFAWMGAWVTLVAVAIMFYYSVVTGWVLEYFVVSLTGELAKAEPQQFYDQFIAGPWPLVLHFISMSLALGVIWRGVGAIERVTTILLPSLFFLIVALAIRAALLPGAERGLKFMFTVDWSQLGNYSIWLEALTQNAWDTGSGWGLITVYAIYVRAKDDSSVNCFLLGIGNNIASLLSGVAVLCTIFAIMPDAEKQIVGAGNYGLTFVWFPQLFAQMPAGGLFMIFFFAALFMAAFMSLISMVELAVRGLQDLGITRNRSLLIAGGIGLLGGVPSAVSLDFLANQDWVWANALIPSGLMFGYVAVKYGLEEFRHRYVNLACNQITIGRWWSFAIWVLVPVQGVVLMVWFFWQTFPGATSASGESLAMTARAIEWLRPDRVENVGTVLAQWAVLLTVLWAANRWMGRSAAEQPS
ncbi:MAG TPA: sodium-dependent transporter [Pirellulales bacterium]|jgi:NSS family neurotransmitter:Na+ symporter